MDWRGTSTGGGTYWMAGFRSLAEDTRRRRAGRSDPASAGEGCGEDWLPHLDPMLPLQPTLESDADACGLPERGRIERVVESGHRPSGTSERTSGTAFLTPRVPKHPRSNDRRGAVS